MFGNLTMFAGRPIKDFVKSGDVALSAKVCPRVRVSWDSGEECADVLSRLLDEPEIGAIEALVIGSWVSDDSEQAPNEVIELLVSSADRLPNLNALFFGDFSGEENEVSWINQGDVSAFWSVFPKLEEFGARGGNGLRLGKINHGSLRKLVVETGGMPANLLHEALEANAPIEHFEVWLGAEDYGASTSVADFTDLFAGELFPNLKTLALRNCEYADDLAAAVAVAPIMDRISELDLSKGNLTDRGARALVAGGKLGGLERIRLDHHYLSDAGLAELKLNAKTLIADNQMEPDRYDDEVYYYIAVSE